jgi:O-antigen/teichoic acid export membrane protein
MSRFRRVIHSIASGYAVLGATAFYSLASVPVALHYLDKESFALWALMATIMGYLSLVDLGMSGSVARLLIDHKDDRGGGVYGSLIQTGWLVLICQGALIWCVGFGVAPILSGLLQIPSDLEAEFVSLLRWQSALLAFGFATKIFSHLLTAHQRLDLINYGQVVGLGANFVLLWTFFSHGHGVFSWVWANLISLMGNAVWLWLTCCKLHLFPQAGTWGRARWQYFRELFGYGKDLFLVTVGTQLIMASQTMIITRTLGLQAAAAWSIGTKMFNLLSQLVWKLFDVSSPALAEMFVRGESKLLQTRYKAIVILSASFSALVAILYALCNSPFVTVWAHGKITWPAQNDLLLGVWMIVMAVLHCHNCFVLITKQIGFMRYIYFVEGVVFVVSALLVAPHGGLPAIIGCSVICSAAFSGTYGVRRISKYFNLPCRDIAVAWMVPMLKVLGLLLPVAGATGWLVRAADPKLQLVVSAALCLPAGLYFFLRFGIPYNFQQELLARAPLQLKAMLRHVFVTVPQ